LFFRPLGNTGIEVSALAMGTVSLGINYGIKAPGQFGRTKPRQSDYCTKQPMQESTYLILHPPMVKANIC